MRKKSTKKGRSKVKMRRVDASKTSSKKTPPEKRKKRRILSRPKGILKNILAKTPSRKRREKKISPSLPVPSAIPQEVISKEGVEIKKFSTLGRSFMPLKEELPSSYGKDRLVVMVRDPWWLYTYWELTPSKLQEVKSNLGEEFSKSEFILRVYDISSIIFDGTNAHAHFDIPINIEAKNWYINLPGDGRSWCLDLGLISPSGFYTILRSNAVTCPSSSPSWVTDEEWWAPWEDFMRLYSKSFGERGASLMGMKGAGESFPSGMFSGVFSGRFAPQALLKKGLFLEVWTELILYGKSDPSANVEVQGRKIDIREDGTFSLRFLLPEGKQIIPVKATSRDKKEKKEIISIVSKETR